MLWVLAITLPFSCRHNCITYVLFHDVSNTCHYQVSDGIDTVNISGGQINEYSSVCWTFTWQVANVVHWPMQAIFFFFFFFFLLLSLTLSLSLSVSLCLSLAFFPSFLSSSTPPPPLSTLSLSLSLSLILCCSVVPLVLFSLLFEAEWYILWFSFPFAALLGPAMFIHLN